MSKKSEMRRMRTQTRASTADRIPTELDWRSEPWDLEIPHAYKHFFGKSKAEAERLFVDCALVYQEDLMWMPSVCLRYYIHAYIDYLLSNESKGDSDGASCFFGFVKSRHKDILTFGEHTQSRTKAVLERLATSQHWFEASVEIYGDFNDRADEALALLHE
jgi:hypothetical protein